MDSSKHSNTIQANGYGPSAMVTYGDGSTVISRNDTSTLNGTALSGDSSVASNSSTVISPGWHVAQAYRADPIDASGEWNAAQQGYFPGYTTTDMMDPWTGYDQTLQPSYPANNGQYGDGTNIQINNIEYNVKHKHTTKKVYVPVYYPVGTLPASDYGSQVSSKASSAQTGTPDSYPPRAQPSQIANGAMTIPAPKLETIKEWAGNVDPSGTPFILPEESACSVAPSDSASQVSIKMGASSGGPKYAFHELPAPPRPKSSKSFSKASSEVSRKSSKVSSAPPRRSETSSKAPSEVSSKSSNMSVSSLKRKTLGYIGGESFTSSSRASTSSSISSSRHSSSKSSVSSSTSATTYSRSGSSVSHARRDSTTPKVSSKLRNGPEAAEPDEDNTISDSMSKLHLESRSSHARSDLSRAKREETGSSVSSHKQHREQRRERSDHHRDDEERGSHRRSHRSSHHH
ncbi:hypothetical protein HD806DRAFT_549898 [Xylariaceae sp. AK1471]|nr:hypothetical protein HD806DRAFT_549898 [Xylariaceae sp. AK1471]